MVPEVTGERPLTVASMWAPYAEHRIPLAKLVHVSVWKLTAGSLRTGMVINVLTMSAMAFAMILTARGLRGGTSYADAFFPLALLNWGNWFNLLWWWQINFILPMALVVALLVVVLRTRGRLTIRAALLAGACLILLPMNGPSGLAFVPAVALWLAYAGLLRWRSGEVHRRRDALLIWGMVAIALLLVRLYLLGLRKPDQRPAAPDLRAVLRATVQFLSMGLGPAASSSWKYYGSGVLGALVISSGLLLRSWYKRPGERLRTLGQLCLTGGMGCLALGLAWGRSGFGENAGLAAHYMIIALPALYCVYFAWGTCYPSAGGKLVQMCLLLLACGLFWDNMRVGLEAARLRGSQMEAFERDLRGGAPPLVLAQRHMEAIAPANDPDTLDGVCSEVAEYMRMLHRTGMGPFRLLRDVPLAPLREARAPVEPASVSQMTWEEDGTGRGTGKGAHLVFALERPRLVYGVRFRCSYKKQNGPALFELSWKDGGRNDFGKERFNLTRLHTKLEEQTVTIWVYDTVDQFRVSPDIKPFVIHITEIVLLVPATDS
jgi:hypothetical protein